MLDTLTDSSNVIRENSCVQHFLCFGTLDASVHADMYALQSFLVADMAAKRVARIGRIGDHTAAVDDTHGLMDQSSLRMGGMYFEILAHKTNWDTRSPYKNCLF